MSSSSETNKRSLYGHQLSMDSSSESDEETWSAPFVLSYEDDTATDDFPSVCYFVESDKKDFASQRPQRRDKWTATSQSEKLPNSSIEEFRALLNSTSLSVGDGHYLLDLGSPSQFVVDEECILQLLQSCRRCHKQCTVEKRVRGLKLVVYQVCYFCLARHKWTNQPDDSDEEDDFVRINRKKAPRKEGEGQEEEEAAALPGDDDGS